MLLKKCIIYSSTRMYAARKIRDTFRANKMINDFKEIDRQVASAKESLELIRRQVSERSISCTQGAYKCAYTYIHAFIYVFVCVNRVHVLTGPSVIASALFVIYVSSDVTIISTTTIRNKQAHIIVLSFSQVIIGHLYTTDKLVIEQKKTLRPSDD